MAPRLLKEEGDEINEAIYNDPTINLNELAAYYGVVYSTIQRHKKKLEERLYTGIDP
jgi:DNA-binding MarR family transcriptional regulator